MFPEIDKLCFHALSEHMNKQVAFYRKQLGFHFTFDFKYMLFINPQENSIYGTGIRVKEYDLLLNYIWEQGSYDGYLNIKNNLFEPCKNELVDYIDNYKLTDYTLLTNSDVERDRFLTIMTKYFQIYLIENQKIIIDQLESMFN
jgi:hypothetical protein